MWISGSRNKRAPSDVVKVRSIHRGRSTACLTAAPEVTGQRRGHVETRGFEDSLIVFLCLWALRPLTQPLFRYPLLLVLSLPASERLSRASERVQAKTCRIDIAARCKLNNILPSLYARLFFVFKYIRRTKCTCRPHSNHRRYMY